MRGALIQFHTPLQMQQCFFGLQNARGIARGAMVFVSLCASMRTALARGA